MAARVFRHVLLAALAGLALSACPPRLPDVEPDGGAVRVLKHAHNDYAHARPLLDALEAGFESVEADVWLDGTGIGVSHGGAPFVGSLRALYLEPLAARVAAQGGSVHGDGQPFYLWLDLKDGSQGLQDALDAELRAWPFLTTWDDAGPVAQGAVTVVLTGTDAAKRALVERPAPRPCVRDSNGYSPDDPPADGRWAFYAVNYFAFLSWAGTGDMGPAQRQQLRNLVAGAHAKGRALRLWSNPDSEAYWQEARDAGVDFVNTDRLSDLAAAFAQ